MFAGKTDRLMKELVALDEQGARSQVFTHTLDTRRGAGQLSTHDGLSQPAIPCETATELLTHLDQATIVVAIDEAQFFGPELHRVVDQILDRKISVLVSGLSVTFDGRPFTPLPELMAVAERVTKLTAICHCGHPAIFHRPVTSQGTDALTVSASQVGGAESYEACCRYHFTRPAQSI